jgi:hypothetical protein
VSSLAGRTYSGSTKSGAGGIALAGVKPPGGGNEREVGRGRGGALRRVKSEVYTQGPGAPRGYWLLQVAFCEARHGVQGRALTVARPVSSQVWLTRLRRIFWAETPSSRRVLTNFCEWQAYRSDSHKTPPPAKTPPPLETEHRTPTPKTPPPQKHPPLRRHRTAAKNTPPPPPPPSPLSLASQVPCSI